VSNRVAEVHSKLGVYIKNLRGEGKLIICLYVDGMLVTRSSEEMIGEFKTQMLSQFETSEIKELSYFLDIEFEKTRRVFLCIKLNIQLSYLRSLE